MFLLLISRLKFSEVLSLSESAVDLFSPLAFIPADFFSLFCRLTQHAHLSVFWGLSAVWVVVGGMSHRASHPHLLPLPRPSLLLHG